MKLVSSNFLKIVFFTAIVTFYLTQVGSTNNFYADSDLFLTLGELVALAHPPGYSIYILLLKLISFVSFGSIALAGNLLSVILQMATLIVLFAMSQHILQTIFAQKTTKLTREFIGLFSVLVLAVSPTFFLNTIFTEKYALNNLLASIIIYLALKLHQKFSIKQYILLMILGVIGLMYHSTLVLVFPAVIWFLHKRKKQVIKNAQLGLSFMVVTVLLSLLVLLLVNNNQAQVSYHFDNSLQGIINNFQRTDLRGVQTTNQQARPLFIFAITPTEIIQKVPAYFELLWQQFGVAWGGIAVGLYALIENRSKWRHSNFLLILVASTTLFIPLYLPWARDLADALIKQRLYLLGFIWLPLLVSVGLAYVFQKQKEFGWLVLSLILVASLNRANQLMQQPPKNIAALWHQMYTQLLEQVPARAVIVCSSDVSCFSLYYLKYSQNLRPDVLILSHGNVIQNQDRSAYCQTDEMNFDSFTACVTQAVSERPTYFIDMQKVYYDWLVEQDSIKLSPQGYLTQLVPAGEEPTELMVDHPIDQYISIKPNQWDSYTQQFLASLAQKHLLNAQIYVSNQVNYMATREINRAESFVGYLPATYQMQVTSARQQLR